ncbi:DUF1353 domain-containing protein [Methylophaga sp. OBS4]|uniref:DUF1353 domain-containing protein n=1 Tax=Methylophaga sp. OBS4 TaxID=2991935 RepID=UPI00225BC447|nr:DUF1353 domain-containing protein [Methylophaga sp. OBS4]MCX4186784.1 DUF1353 domain-containing protein [Methylophaga sp. OBS4]
MNHYVYDPMQYRSPQRLWDPVTGEFVDRWITTSDFDIQLPDGRQIHIPIGFIYDKASVPRLVWWYIPRDDRHINIAALVHDYLYEIQQIENDWIVRKEADQHFHGIIKQSGMRPTKAYAAYAGVRAGGWRFYNKRARRLGNPFYGAALT